MRLRDLSHELGPGHIERAVNRAGFRPRMAKIASDEARFLRNNTGDAPLSMEISEPWPMQMNTLPVDRALSIYGALANRAETKGARDKLSQHLMKKFSEGEKDQHRLTVHGLSYLQNLDRELDSKN